jgi:chitinase
MNYDYFGSWDNKVGFNAPLKNNENELSVMFAIEYFLKMGAPANKLVMVNNIYK